MQKFEYMCDYCGTSFLSEERLKKAVCPCDNGHLHLVVEGEYAQAKPLQLPAPARV